MDTDYANETIDGMSASGGVIMCAGACVSFYSKMQKSSALSSTKAEYVAMATGFRKTIFMRYLSSFIFPARDVRYHTVKEVNRGAIHLAKILVTTSNSKHINIRHRFLRDVWSALHHADFFTKPFQNGGVSFLTQLCDEFLAISSYLF